MSQVEEAIATPLATEEKDQEEEGEGCLFSCRCESARSVSTLLSCLKNVGSSTEDNFGYATPMTVFCSPTCLTFHISGKSRQCQASVDMQAGLFSDYRVLQQRGGKDSTAGSDQQKETDDDWQAGGEFCVNLVAVLECLHVLGSSGPSDTTPLTLSYDLDTEVFRMELFDDGGVLSTAALPGVIPSPTDSTSSLALAFRSTPIVARLICSSHTLKEAMHEVELVHGATCCTVALSTQQGLELAVIGDAGECLVSLPASSTLLLESQTTKAHTYPLPSLKSGMKAVDIAQETCISINAAGMMAIQHQVLDTVGTGQPNFVDFIMGCLQDEEGEEERENLGAVPEASQEEAEASMHATQTSLASQRSEPQSSMAWNGNDDASSSAVPQDRLEVSHRDEHSGSDDHSSHQREPRTAFRKVIGSQDESDDDSLPPVSSTVQSLFGSVVVGKTSRTRRRKRSSRPRSSSSRHLSSNAGTDDDSDAESRSLLQSPQEEESQPLDITAPVRSTRQRRSIDQDHYDGSSSPEIHYGTQMTQDEL